MASFLTPAETKRYLDSRTNSIYYEPGNSELVIFTVPPTITDETGSDGTEVTGGGYTRVVVDFGPAATGSAGRTGQVANAASITIADMPVDSTLIQGYALADAATHEIWYVNDGWVPSTPFDVGGNLHIGVDELQLYGQPA